MRDCSIGCSIHGILGLLRMKIYEGAFCPRVHMPRPRGCMCIVQYVASCGANNNDPPSMSM